AGYDGDRHGVYVMDVDGSHVDPILRLEEFDSVEALAWSPDGTRIAMLREIGGEGGTQDGDWTSTIWTLAPDGSDLRRITTSGRETGLSWSPDSSRLAISRHE